MSPPFLERTSQESSSDVGRDVNRRRGRGDWWSVKREGREGRERGGWEMGGERDRGWEKSASSSIPRDTLCDDLS
jgi:hypothetical protein